MKVKNCFTRWPSILIYMLPAILVSCSGDLAQNLLFEDGFESLPVGSVSSAEDRFSDLHFIPGAGQVGPWSISSFGKESGYMSAWEIIEGKQGNYLRQNFHNVDQRLDLNQRDIHPLIIAGDSTWHDYRAEFRFRPYDGNDKCGIVFRYRNDRSFYFYGMEGNTLVIKLVKDATAPYRPFEQTLASSPFTWEIGKSYKGAVSTRENKIYTLLNDSISLVAQDNTFSRGMIGFLSDAPADFLSLEVITLKRERRKITRYKSELARVAARRISESPKPVIWKKIATPGFGTGRNLRFGDLDGDGDPDILIGQVRKEGREGKMVLGCLTAITFDNELLWQKGSPNPENYMVTGDFPFQVHDLDGDGAREVIYVMNERINLVEGRSGAMLKSLALPEVIRTKKQGARSIFFCDLQGKGRDSNMLITDGNETVVAFDEHLNQLWFANIPAGDYPSAFDIDGDQKDEIAVGHTMLDDDGAVLWSADSRIGDRSVSVLIARPGQPADSTLKVINAAGAWGSLVQDLKGNILVHNPVGHVQHMTLANFRGDLPGLEMVSSNFWGNQGIINLYDADGMIYHTFEPGQAGSMCFPVNWRGDSEEFFLLNTSPGNGGMYDGNGRLMVTFPDDNHPVLCSYVLDLVGDSRDEIITWDQAEIWVYTQDGGPRQGRLYSPVRTPLYNASNYQFTLSEPSWSE